MYKGQKDIWTDRWELFCNDVHIATVYDLPRDFRLPLKGFGDIEPTPAFTEYKPLFDKFEELQNSGQTQREEFTRFYEVSIRPLQFVLTNKSHNIRWENVRLVYNFGSDWTFHVGDNRYR